jgi:hypothetical protein
MRVQINFLVEFADKIERRNKRNIKRRAAKGGAVNKEDEDKS